MSGTVVETMDSGGYTYVQVDTGSQKIWAAGPQKKIQFGDKVIIPSGMSLQNFHSKSLNRDFSSIYFVGAIIKEGESTGSAPSDHAAKSPGMTSANVEVKAGSIKKAEGGETVGDIFKNKTSLSGKKVTLRGKVVKFTPQVMGKNWIHLQDGTGSQGSNDLTVTTAAEVAKGATVLLTGQLAVDKDFGYGYNYDVIVEDAQIKVE
ncbi:MAG: DNA-binding protein [Proteobacteria bacterium]|nr:DNA-binding protein [Pseudomonadota bacterium]